MPRVLRPLLLGLVASAPGADAMPPCAPGSAGHGRPWCDATLPLNERVISLVDAIPESTYPDQLTNGNFGGAPSNVTSLGIPTFDFANEACHGLLKCGVCAIPCSKGASCCDDACEAAPTSFPQVIGTAASFNVTLWRTIGATISTEARAIANTIASGGYSGAINFWAPNMNLLRDPRWGRAQEVPGEDPLVNGDYAVHFVQGMQEGEDHRYLKVGATCKHAFGYSLEGGDAAHPDGRVDRHHFNAVVTPQDAADTYLPPFERCVREGKAASLMCAYDSWNGVPSCANKALMTDLARTQWNFTGAWVSDCGAINDVFANHNFTTSRVQAVKAVIDAGLDLNCGNFLQDNLDDALASGAVSASAVQSSLKRLYMLRMRLGEFDDAANQPYRDVRKYGREQLHHPEIALDAARQAVVLLKNNKVSGLLGRAESNELLPLSGNSLLKLAVLGPHAGDNRLLKGNYAGNSQPSDNLVEALRHYAREVEYVRGAANDSMAWRGLCGDSDVSPVAAVASAAVKRADAIVMTIGTDGSHLSGNPYPAAGNTSFECWSGNCMENEGCDRTSISLPKVQRSLLATVLDAAKIRGTPVVLIVFSGGAVDLSFAKDAVGVSAILWAGFPGPAGATAIAETLFGLNAPSGRLTQTFYSEGFSSEVAMTDMGMRPGAHSMGRGYRFYAGRAVVYPFGHGMHYTEFGLSNGIATETGVSIVVRNAGSVTSAVALLVFLVPPAPAISGGAPKRFLAAYEKLQLTSHETRKVLLAYYVHALHLARPDGTKELVAGEWTAEFSVGGTTQPLTTKFTVRDHIAY